MQLINVKDFKDRSQFEMDEMTIKAGCLMKNSLILTFENGWIYEFPMPYG
jgi:hypothetical protein